MRDLKLKFPADASAELDNLLWTTKDVRIFRRAQAVRKVVAGSRIQTVANALQYPYSALRKWVYRFAQDGVEGLSDRPRAGRPRKVTPEIANLIWELSQSTPTLCNEIDTQWSCLTLSNLVQEQTGVELSRESIRRVLKARQ